MPVIYDDEERSYRGQSLPARRVAAPPGVGFVAAPYRCPASLTSPLLAVHPAALATQPAGLSPRAARVSK
jgi:hypothetical protein